MKRLLSFTLPLILLVSICNAQSPANKVLYNNMFKWRLIVPGDFKDMSPTDYAKTQQKGMDAIEKTYDQKVDNQSKPIFVFKNDLAHYFESNYQPFDEKKNGDFATVFKATNDVVYNTFKAQMNNVEIDSTSMLEKVSNLNFHVFKAGIKINSNVTLTYYMFSRLFTDKEFTVVVMYIDEQKGKVMLDAFRNSTFGK